MAPESGWVYRGHITNEEMNLLVKLEIRNRRSKIYENEEQRRMDEQEMQNLGD